MRFLRRISNFVAERLPEQSSRFEDNVETALLSLDAVKLERPSILTDAGAAATAQRVVGPGQMLICYRACTVTLQMATPSNSGQVAWVFPLVSNVYVQASKGQQVAAVTSALTVDRVAGFISLGDAWAGLVGVP